MRFSAASLGLKLNLSLLFFLLVLGSATAAIILVGFSRAQQDATASSREGLEEMAERYAELMAQLQAGFGDLQMESAADIGQRTARYLVDAAPGAPRFDASRLERGESGQLHDPDPDRISDLVMPNFAPLSDAALEDMAFSASLDAVFPSLLQNYPGLVRDENFTPIAVFFSSVNQVTRYYPPIGLAGLAAPDTDVSPLFEMVGLESNPDRKTVWTTPYEDEAGHGLVITAYTPVYDGETLRGVIGVDLSLQRLIDQVDLVKPTPGSFAFYVDRDGVLLRSPAFDTLMAELAEGGNPALSAALDSMLAGQRGIERVRIGGEEMFVGYAPMTEVGGGFAVAMPIAEITAQAAEITALIEERGSRTLLVSLLAMGGLFVVGLAGATWLNRRVVLRPIAALVQATRRVAEGDLESEIPVEGEDELATLARSFNQMTDEIRDARLALERRVEERTRELATLLEVSRDVASTLELGPLLRLVIDQVKTIADYSRCNVFTLEGDQVVLLDSRSEVRASAISLRVPVAEIEAVWDEIRRGRSVIIADVTDDTPLAAAYRRSAPELVPSSQTRSWMGVPLASQDRLIGMLTFSHVDVAFYTEHHARLVGAIAAQIAIAIENARLYQQAQQLAAVEERQRLARELHDSVSQALYGIALGTSTARTLLDKDPARAVEPIEYVLSLAEAGLAEMRALIFELRPESLEIEGLVSALEKQVAATSARYGIQVISDLGSEPGLTPAEKEVFYRVGQEALHNVVKHARATSASVRLRSDEHAVTLEVRDNGAGFDAGASYPGHIGLVSMRERAAGIGARLSIDSAPGQGTTIVLTRPATGAGLTTTPRAPGIPAG